MVLGPALSGTDILRIFVFELQDFFACCRIFLICLGGTLAERNCKKKKKWFEKWIKKIRKTIRNVTEKIWAPLRSLKIFHRHFSKSFHRPNFAKIECLFTARICRGGYASIFCRRKCPENPGKSPAKASKRCTTKIPDTFLQRGQAKKTEMALLAVFESSRYM